MKVLEIGEDIGGKIFKIWDDNKHNAPIEKEYFAYMDEYKSNIGSDHITFMGFNGHVVKTIWNDDYRDIIRNLK